MEVVSSFFRDEPKELEEEGEKMVKASSGRDGKRDYMAVWEREGKKFVDENCKDCFQFQIEAVAIKKKCVVL